MSDNYKKINKSQVAVLKALARINIDEALGGTNTVSYELLSPICAVEMNLDLGYTFGVAKIEDIAAADFDEAIEYFIEWEPSEIIKNISDDIEEDFSYKIPVLISVDEKYETEKASIGIDDFYYEIINDNILKVKIDLILDDLYYKEERSNLDLEVNEQDNLEVSLDTEKIDINFDKENVQENNLYINISDNEKNMEGSKITDLFKESDTDKEYSIYRVYTISEGDTLDTILDKYKITKDNLEQYNDLTKLDIGTKLIIPSSDE